MSNETLDYECTYCGFKAKTQYDISVHLCDGKRSQREAIKMGQKLQTAVVMSQ